MEIRHLLDLFSFFFVFGDALTSDCCFSELAFFFFHLMATVNWLTILPLFGCAHKNLNIPRRNKVKFIYSASKNSVI